MSELIPPDHLRFSSAILRLLGEELNPSPNQGIVELVKNSYDADSTWCQVELEGEHLPRGTLRIRDNGDGMTREEIRSGWLIVGESRKLNTGFSKRQRRAFVGSKGLGRLAALRLGRKATLTTRSREEPNIEHCLSIDWESYDGVRAVDSVPLSIVTRDRELGASHGSEIVVSDLYEPWTPAAVRKLARTLHLLSDPFAGKSDTTIGRAKHAASEQFSVIFKSEAFDHVVQEASEDYWTHFEYHVVSGVDESGKGWARVKDASGRTAFEASHEDLVGKRAGVYHVPAFEFELWEFSLDPKRFATSTINLNALKRWLSEFGGVHLYYRNVRVSPYGDPGNDWLDMNLGRSRSPEHRPSTNNSIGRIRVQDPKGLLVQLTDRQGFSDNQEFEQLRSFTSDILLWMQLKRVKKRDERKRAQKQEAEESKDRSVEELKREVAKLPEVERKPLEKAVETHLRAIETTISLLEDDSQLYHTLGTIGTTAAAFAHQSAKPLDLIQENSRTLEFLLGDPTKPSFPELSLASLRRIHSSAQALLAFSNVTLRLLDHEKRNRGRQNLHRLIGEIVELLKPYLDHRDAEVFLDFKMEEPVVYGSRAAIESIFTNLIINSLRAFARDYSDVDDADVSSERSILIRTQKLGDRVRITFMDSGPGIKDISVDDIWIAGRTTTPKGSGLGLCIVRDTIEDMGGTIGAEANGTELNGAEFTIELPLKQ